MVHCGFSFITGSPISNRALVNTFIKISSPLTETIVYLALFPNSLCKVKVCLITGAKQHKTTKKHYLLL